MAPPTPVAANTLAPPLSVGCARVERAYATQTARIRQTRARSGDDSRSLDDLFEVFAPTRGCFATTRGAWAFLLDAARVDAVLTELGAMRA